MVGKFIKNTLLVTGITLLSAGSATAEPTELALSELIMIGLENSPRIEVTRQQYEASEGVLTQAKSGYLPQVSVGAGFGEVYMEDMVPEDQDSLVNGSIKLSQLVVDFGKTTGLINASSYSRDAARENFNEIAAEVVFDTKEAFYQVLANQRLVTVAEESVENFEQQLYRAQKYYEAGVRTKIDVTNAEVNLSNQKLSLLQANQNLKLSRTSLENIIGVRPNNGDYELISYEPPLEKLAASKPDLPAALEDLLVTATENRPGLARFELLVNASESSLDQAEGEYWPTLGVTGEYQTFESDLPTFNDQWQVQLGLTWDIFTGFRTKGEVAEAKAQLAEVKAGLREFELALTREVTDSYLRAEANRDGVDIADNSLGLAEENLELADGRYKAGIGDILEFNDAQLLYTENQSNLVITYYNYLIAIADIERSIGMTPELIDYEWLELEK